MIAAREEISAKIESAQGALTRLASAQTAEAPLVAELQRLDALETEAFSAWSRGDSDAPAPTPDVAKRALLTEQLAAARAKAEAARRAEGGLIAERERESSKLPGLARAIDAALAEILVEESEPLVADFDETNRIVAAKASRIEVLRDILEGMARSAGEGEPARPFYALLEQFNTRLQRVSGRQRPDLDVVSSHRLGWLSLAESLRLDANATLEPSK
jgi:hypothetical protein